MEEEEEAETLQFSKVSHCVSMKCKWIYYFINLISISGMYYFFIYDLQMQGFLYSALKILLIEYVVISKRKLRGIVFILVYSNHANSMIQCFLIYFGRTLPFKPWLTDFNHALIQNHVNLFGHLLSHRDLTSLSV